MGRLLGITFKVADKLIKLPNICDPASTKNGTNVEVEVEPHVKG